MPMYIPPAFREDRQDVLHDLIRRHSFATLVSATGGTLQATHLPFLLDATEGGRGTLRAHMARANPHWQSFDSGDEVLVMFQGPHAFVSPAWYETELTVPTWNYVAVHAYGPAEFFEDADRLLEIVSRLTDLHERPRAEPWAVSDAPEPFVRAQLRGIVGLRLPIARLEGKRKMSQNRGAADRAGVVAGLAASERASDRAVAALIPE
jgi:transcriptional regulator